MRRRRIQQQQREEQDRQRQHCFVTDGRWPSSSRGIRNGLRTISSSTSSTGTTQQSESTEYDEDDDDEKRRQQQIRDGPLDADDESEDEKATELAFATSYHAPVMVHECIDALLGCSRASTRRRRRKQSIGTDDGTTASDDHTEALSDPDNDDSNNNGNKRKKKKRRRSRKTAKKKWKSDDVVVVGEKINDDGGGGGDEVVEPLIFVDGTLGGGGHSEALLRELRAGDVVFGCDVDPAALATATERLRQYVVAVEQNEGDRHTASDGDAGSTGTEISDTGSDEERDGYPIFIPVQSNFCDLHKVLPSVRHPRTGELILKDGIGVDGILLDLGVSSYQIDTPERGFAFMKHGPLDMRMGRRDDKDGGDGRAGISAGSLTAADVCNEFDEDEIARILRVYGDEPRARSIASSIADRRPIETTTDLVEAVAAVTPRFARRGRRMGRTATLARVFQSLRIVVNREDAALEKALVETAPSLLRRNGQGRLAVLSYHSLEDRATKRVMRDGTVSRHGSSSRAEQRDIYGNYIGKPTPFRSLGKAKKASEREVESNPRSRSATLRVAERQ